MPACFPSRLFLIAGPCQVEGDDLMFRVADHLARLAEKVPGGIIFKSSFDKANRSNPGAMRGPGIDAGLASLVRVRERSGLPVLTDVHLPEQCAAAAQAVDVLQIPAFLCRQTDLVIAAGQSGRAVNVKKGQFLSPEGVNPIAEKLKSVGCKDYWITERGTSFGYNNLVVDMRGLATMREAGHRVIFDATHSVQRPGSLGSATGGDGAMAPVLARAATAAGIDGLFIETHPDPSKSPSDGPNMIPLAELPKVLRTIARIHAAI